MSITDLEEIHEGDIGTILRATIKNDGAVVDISGATTLEIKLKKPSGAVLTKTGILVTDGTDGQVQYITISGDLDESSETEVWKIQGHVVTPAGDWNSDIKDMPVFPNL